MLVWLANVHIICAKLRSWYHYKKTTSVHFISGEMKCRFLVFVENKSGCLQGIKFKVYRYIKS